MVSEKLCEELASLNRDEWEMVKACMDAVFSGCYDSLYEELANDQRFQNHGKTSSELYEMLNRSTRDTA